MGILNDLRKRVADFNEALSNGDIISDFIKDKEDEIVEMNSESQLYERGIDSEGVEIMRYAPYSDMTIYIKQSKGQPYDRVTLRDTGDFHYSFQVETERDRFSIIATDEKTEDLIDKYGEDIFGLTGEHKEELSEMLLPHIMNEAKKMIMI